MKVIKKNEILIFKEITKNLSKKWTINSLSTKLGLKYRPIYSVAIDLINRKYIKKNENNLLEPKYFDTFFLQIGEKIRLLEFNNKDIKIIKERFEKNIGNSYYSTILFGSSVAKKGKDIDLLFIVPTSSDSSKFEEKINKSLGSFENIVDVNIITEESAYEMLNRPNQTNVMNEIMKNHLVLIGVENFYNILKKWKNDK